MTFKTLPESLIDATKKVIDPTQKAAAIAVIDKNVEQRAISPEVATELKKQWETSVVQKKTSLLNMIAHPLAEGMTQRKMDKLHNLSVHVAPTAKKKKGQAAYKVIRVGRGVQGIKAGDHLNDSELDDATELGHKIKMVKEQNGEEYTEEELNELSKKTLVSYVKKSSDSLWRAGMDRGKREGEHEVAQAALGWVSQTKARRDAQDILHTARFKADAQTRKTEIKRVKGIDRATKKLIGEEELEEARVAGKFAVISQQHEMDGGAEPPGAPHIHGYDLSHENAHKLAAKIATDKSSKYPAKHGFEVKRHDDTYHIMGPHEDYDEHRSWEAVHVRPMKKKKELGEESSSLENSDIVEPSKLTEKVDRELGHLMRKKVKDMTAADKARYHELVSGKKRKSTKSVQKEEIEADQNILVHLRKAVDTDGKHEIDFLDGFVASVEKEVAETVLEHVLRLKPEARVQVQEYMQQSLENVYEVFQHIVEVARPR